MTKLRVGLLFGGRSGEHDVSIQSAHAILEGLQAGENASKYDVFPVYIQKNGVWQAKEAAQAVVNTRQANDVTANDTHQRWQFPAQVADIDVWFPILHGPNGEDGTIQGLLSLMQIPFVGSGVLGSAVGMDKIAMKTAFAKAGLAQVKYVSLLRSQIYSNPCVFPKLCDDIEQAIGYPAFVKPANLGSSVGIAKVKSRSELEVALDNAASYDRRIIVEAGVTAREVECAVLGNEQAKASVVGEIEFESDFYDYETKYTAGRARLNIPASLPDNAVKKIQEMSLQAFKAIDGAGLARVDFFYIPETGQILINEINTLPGFTAFSMYPQLWSASGIPFPKLVDHLIQLALEK